MTSVLQQKAKSLVISYKSSFFFLIIKKKLSGEPSMVCLFVCFVNQDSGNSHVMCNSRKGVSLFIYGMEIV